MIFQGKVVNWVASLSSTLTKGRHINCTFKRIKLLVFQFSLHVSFTVNQV